MIPFRFFFFFFDDFIELHPRIIVITNSQPRVDKTVTRQQCLCDALFVMWKIRRRTYHVWKLQVTTVYCQTNINVLQPPCNHIDNDIILLYEKTFSISINLTYFIETLEHVFTWETRENKI